MRAIAIIMVVGVHSLGYCLPLPVDQRQLISFIVHTISVPVFFLVDGYLLGRSLVITKNYNFSKYVKGSTIRLLLPWAVFTFFYTLSRYIFELTGFLSERIILGHSWQEILASAYGSVYAPQMYFLLSLFLIRLCSPIIKMFFVNKNIFVIILIFLCYLAVYNPLKNYLIPYLSIKGGQEPILHALWGFQFYFLGAIILLAYEKVDIKNIFPPLLMLFIVFLVIKNTIFIVYLNRISQILYLLIFSLFFITFKINIRPFNVIGENTMGIYLIHAPIVLKGVSIILNRFLTIPLASYLSILFVVTVLSLLITLSINSIPYGSLLFGASHNRAQITR